MFVVVLRKWEEASICFLSYITTMVRLREPTKTANGACDVEFLFIAQYEAEHRVLLGTYLLAHLAVLIKYGIISSAHHFQKADVAQPFLEFCEINRLNGLVSGPGTINGAN